MRLTIFWPYFWQKLRFPSLVVLAILLWSSCSILIGHVKPEEQKSTDVKIEDLSALDKNWHLITLGPGANPHPSPTSDDVPDAAWQSTATDSVISIDSACSRGDSEDQTLTSITQTLLSQWNNLNIISQRSVQVSGKPGLETTAEGYYLSRNRKFQTVAVKTPTCIYDLIFLSQIKTFDQDLAVFQKFRDNLILK